MFWGWLAPFFPTLGAQAGRGASKNPKADVEALVVDCIEEPKKVSKSVPWVEGLGFRV